MALNPLTDQHIVALAGGVGGAKLAHGLAQIVAPGHLSIIGNVGDDFERYGLHISPDLDTVMYTLAGKANPKTGWGLQGETWNNLEMMRVYGEDPWFSLGDHDLATHILRTHWLKEGLSLTEITHRLSQHLGLSQHLLPVTDDPLATVVDTVEYGILPFQEYFVKHRWQPQAKSVSYHGAAAAVLSAQAQTALDNADLIVICPSNPILSIAPILAVPQMRQYLLQRRVPVILVSPLIGGKAVKGPTDKLMNELGLDASTLGIARYYADLIDTIVVDIHDHHELKTVRQEFNTLRIFETPTLMKTTEDRRSLAERLLNHISEAI